VRRRREHSESATTIHNARAAAATAHATYEVPVIRDPKPLSPEPARAATPEPPTAERPKVNYIPDNFDDVDSEIVRHAEPFEQTLQRQAAAAEPMETVSSGVDIQYNADDLEIPAFLRKRAEG
ncbi:MAG: hypothetical protein WBW69_11070, partial [Candidatus Korobacteraceae bacterium]